MTLIEKIVASPHDYTLDVETLGECKIDSPIRNREFIDPDERILITENVKLLHEATRHLGITPSFERAGPTRRSSTIRHGAGWASSRPADSARG